MALPKGKPGVQNTQAPGKSPSGSRPKGPDRIPTKAVTPQQADGTKKKGPGLGGGSKPKGG